MTWKESDIRKKEKAGTIRGAVIPKRVKLEGSERIPPDKSKALIWLEWNLWYFCNEKALTLKKEYQFSEDRRFRSDWAIEAHKILIEFEGGIFMECGGHNSARGIQRDIDKYALAEKLGYKVIRLTALNYSTVLKTLNELIK